MKRIQMMLFAALIMLPQIIMAQNYGEAPELKVMSFNIRYGDASDGTNSWNLRYAAAAEMIEDQKPDVMGLQEALSYQVLFIEENFRDYKCIGVGRENGKKEGEHMSIFWNKKTVSMLDWGTFWLSETPEKPSMGWDAACRRTATWALMKCKRTGNKFYFVNTHLDHVGVEARKNGLQLVMDRVAQMNKDNLPVVLTGDFNVQPSDACLSGLDAKMKSARKVAMKTDDKGTYNNWGKNSEVIDYIYFSGFRSCPEFQTVTKKYAKRTFVSDHFPIFAKLIF